MLCDKKSCTGCFACINICPKNAISMVEDEYGYIYPRIEKDKCINCKLCEKSCPAINNVELKYPIKCYAAVSKEQKLLNKSTSGGVATVLAKKIIQQGGIVYGAAYVRNCEVNHIRVDNMHDLEKLQGSKYVHSYIKDCYKHVKKDLLDNKKVLFIGTPCQIAGLKKYLPKDYENLYLVDIICHGVPSQKFLKEEVRRVNNNIVDIDRVNFRDKQFSNFTFSINKNKKVIYSEEYNTSPYFYTFLKSITYRENCYSCRYATAERCSDVTIGDFWGLGEDSIFYKNRKNGVSVVLPITDKGLKLIESVSKELKIEERQIQEAVNGNDQLKKYAYKSKMVDRFKNMYKQNNSFFVTYKKVCKKHYYKEKIKSNVLVKQILKIKSGVKNG